MKDFVPPIYFAWSLVATVAGVACRPDKAKDFLQSVAAIWAGMLIALSFTEAWVKFRAPLLERHVAFDVGRHVFTALNTIEVVAAQTMMLVLYRCEYPRMRESMWAIPVTLCVLLLMQVGFLTPSLEKRAERVIADALADKRHARREEEKMFKLLTAKLTFQRTPSKALHQVYVLVEVTKLLLLLYYSYSMAMSA